LKAGISVPVDCSRDLLLDEEDFSERKDENLTKNHQKKPFRKVF
jgi:hypothetical protein